MEKLLVLGMTGLALVGLTACGDKKLEGTYKNTDVNSSHIYDMTFSGNELRMDAGAGKFVGTYEIKGDKIEYAVTERNGEKVSDEAKDNTMILDFKETKNSIIVKVDKSNDPEETLTK
ncbi:hypothetical protein [Lactococcus petauri]|uniref:Uncharacterized protein n=1 Tax=Lactococcus petauri TaxID=1940789 RepID=A0A252CBD7_9LACT|nr:hypothetical protein [Lactococcus petauri]OUK03864.1 hypothetical protein BZZ03_09440 [Lactococcus petauri]